jgi:hypothetical protein
MKDSSTFIPINKHEFVCAYTKMNMVLMLMIMEVIQQSINDAESWIWEHKLPSLLKVNLKCKHDAWQDPEKHLMHYMLVLLYLKHWTSDHIKNGECMVKNTTKYETLPWPCYF